MLEKLQASLAETGFTDITVSLGNNRDILFAHYGQFGHHARRAAWKASALIFPTTYVCWGCFESNAGFTIQRHCGSCPCCDS